MPSPSNDLASRLSRCTAVASVGRADGARPLQRLAKFLAVPSLALAMSVSVSINVSLEAKVIDVKGVEASAPTRVLRDRDPTLLANQFDQLKTSDMAIFQIRASEQLEGGGQILMLPPTVVLDHDGSPTLITKPQAKAYLNERLDVLEGPGQVAHMMREAYRLEGVVPFVAAAGSGDNFRCVVGLADYRSVSPLVKSMEPARAAAKCFALMDPSQRFEGASAAGVPAQDLGGEQAEINLVRSNDRRLEAFGDVFATLLHAQRDGDTSAGQALLDHLASDARSGRLSYVSEAVARADAMIDADLAAGQRATQSLKDLGGLGLMEMAMDITVRQIYADMGWEGPGASQKAEAPQPSAAPREPVEESALSGPGF